MGTTGAGTLGDYPAAECQFGPIYLGEEVRRWIMLSVGKLKKGTIRIDLLKTRGVHSVLISD
jgi:hypothetical protein